MLERIIFSPLFIFLIILSFIASVANLKFRNELPVLLVCVIFFTDLASQFISGYPFKHYLIIPTCSLYILVIIFGANLKHTNIQLNKFNYLFLAILLVVPLSYSARSLSGFYKDSHINYGSKLNLANNILDKHILDSSSLLIIDLPEILHLNNFFQLPNLFLHQYLVLMRIEMNMPQYL